MTKVVAAVEHGARIIDLCEMGDDFITEAAKSVYNKGKVLKGTFLCPFDKIQ